MQQKTTSPWAWIPSLYLAQGLPYVAVMVISVIMYKRMGVSNSAIAYYTSWLYLPWVIKPLWSPFVDLLKTKRWWIFTMQLLIGAGFAGIAFTIPLPFYFQATLAFFWLMAFSSATHDIAADGFYMLGLNSNQQALYVGIRSTFYRIATILGQGVLIILAGFLETTSGAEPLKIQIEASPKYTQNALLIPQAPVISEQAGNITFLADKNVISIGTHGINKDTLKTFVGKVAALNEQNGFIIKETVEQKNNKSDISFWTKHVSQPFGRWIKDNFGEKKEVLISDKAGNISILAVCLSKKPEAGKIMILNTTLNNGDKSISLLHGERLTFTENNWNQPAYMIFQADPKLTASTKAEYKGLSGNMPFAWSITFFVLAGLFVLFSFYHRIGLPKPAQDAPSVNMKANDIFKEFGETFVSFFKKPQILTALFFMLTFRFAEAQLVKLINPFLLDPLEKGGLGLSTGAAGFVYGTMGILGLTAGGIIGGITASRGGLRKWLWLMTACLLLPTATFLYLSYSQTGNLLLINLCVVVEQFGYGFGFTAYMLYLIYFSQGRNKTAHYAICTGFMALGMMIPGMFAGWLQELLGYNHFFIWLMICSIIPVIAVSLLKIEPEFGKK
jgi:PAT family beta-lactamase induction signal transducer AmpG